MGKKLQGKRGVAMIEYALIASLVGLFLVAALTGLRGQIATVFNNVRTALGGS